MPSRDRGTILNVVRNQILRDEQIYFSNLTVISAQIFEYLKRPDESIHFDRRIFI
jgi:hypothetical protein